MLDSYGRVIDYLRVSVVDRCNLRCVYCMPAEGIKTTDHKEILTFDEIVRICRIMSERMGLKKIKLTGGEPLCRKDLDVLVRQLKELPGIERVTLTTNAVELAENLPALADAGLDGINISLDTLNPELFRKITRRDRLDDVKRGIEAALAYPGITLKINCVPIGSPEQDLTQIAGIARDHRIHVRFIEMMPIGYGKQFEFQSEDSIRRQLEARFGPSRPFDGVLGSGPCHYISFEGFEGKIGFISAISHKFCSGCNRVRLTATGCLKSCLQYNIGTMIKKPMREGITDDELAALIARTIQDKPIGHQFNAETIEEENDLTMSQIGG